MENTILLTPIALYVAPLDVPEMVLLATAKTLREMGVTITPDQAEQFRKIKELTPCD